MSEEIKDILEHLSATQKINNGWTSFSDKECKLLYDYITKLQQEENIIKEVRDYIKKHSQMTNLQINGIENVLSFRGSVEELLEILEKVEE